MPNFSKKIQIISMDSRHQRNIYQIVHKFFTKFKKYTKFTQNCCNRKGRRRGRPCTRVPRQNETAPASHVERNGGSSAFAPLLVNQCGPPRAVPLFFAHVHAALLGGGHAAWTSRPPTWLPREKPWGTAGATTRPKLSDWFSIDG